MEVYDRNIRVALDEIWKEMTAWESIRKVIHWETRYQPCSDTQQDKETYQNEFVNSLDTSSLGRKVGFSGAVQLSPNVPFAPLAGEGKEGLTYPESDVWELSTKCTHSFFRMFSGIHEMRFS